MGRNPQQNGSRFPSLPPEGGQEIHHYTARRHADPPNAATYFNGAPQAAASKPLKDQK
ncbi:hypothetical protein JCM12178A_24580 [Salidesulfovibrio brasiliensis]